MRGEIIGLLGPSGCGKSTLLRIIAGLEKQDTGEILFEGQPLDPIPTHLRGFGLMFQDFALFPHRTVAENVAFGLRMQNQTATKIALSVKEQLAMVGLDPDRFGDRDIEQLSGGERQRVALARSIAPRPRLLMLDEPLGSLDRALREQLTEDIHRLIKSLGLTAIYVTHDQTEAYSLCDRIAIMHNGALVQCDSPAKLYRHPNSHFVAQFLGLGAQLNGTVIAVTDPHVLISTPLGQMSVECDILPPPSPGANVWVIIRPEAAYLPSPDQPLINPISGKIIRHTFRGNTNRIQLQHASGYILDLDWASDITDPNISLQLNPRAMSLIVR